MAETIGKGPGGKDLAGVGEFPRYSEKQLDNPSRPGGACADSVNPAMAGESAGIARPGGHQDASPKGGKSDTGMARPGGHQSV